MADYNEKQKNEIFLLWQFIIWNENISSEKHWILPFSFVYHTKRSKPSKVIKVSWYKYILTIIWSEDF